MRGNEMNLVADAVLPVRRAGIEIRRQRDVQVLCDAGGEPRWVLNESALALWQLCDGDTALGEMVDAICSLCNVSEERAFSDVNETLVAFTVAGLLGWVDGT